VHRSRIFARPLSHDAVHVPVRIDTSYPVLVRPLDELHRFLDEIGLEAETAIIVSDENVWSIHGGRLKRLIAERWSRFDSIILPAGEESKSIARLTDIHDRALAMRIDRRTAVIAFGGGVIGDLAGFAAATLLRGLPLIQLPTSMIAQVDSSIGGKTGINHATGKNLIGAFHSPVLVLADPSLLDTLPDREYFSGLAEVVKHALIADADLATWLEGEFDSILARDRAVVKQMIQQAMHIKVDVVSEDLLEHGRRAHLNFGHTFGHAIERVSGYGTFTHGEAVAVGMRAAAYLSELRHPQVDFSVAHRLISRIPVQPSRSELDAEQLIDAMSFDKKVVGGAVRFVLIRDVGDAYVARDVEASQVREAIEFAKSE
jgi:3-dehydroquinate synthase